MSRIGYRMFTWSILLLHFMWDRLITGNVPVSSYQKTLNGLCHLNVTTFTKLLELRVAPM